MYQRVLYSPDDDDDWLGFSTYLPYMQSVKGNEGKEDNGEDLKDDFPLEQQVTSLLFFFVRKSKRIQFLVVNGGIQGAYKERKCVFTLADWRLS